MGRNMNPSGGQIALAAGAAILGGLAMSDIFTSSKSKKSTGSKSTTESDPLPDGAEDGFLPKDKDYGSQIPNDMTSGDLWVSDDCKAFLVGKHWMPRVGGLDPYQWMLQPEQITAWEKINHAMMQAGETKPIDKIPNAIVVDPGALIQARYPPYPRYKGAQWGDFETYAEVGIYPTDLPMVTRFELAVLQGTSPSAASCANTIPAGGPLKTKAQWEAAFKTWQQKFPGLSHLLGFIGAASVVDIQAAIDSHLSGLDF